MKFVKRLLQKDKERRTTGKVSLPSTVVKILNRWSK